VLRRLRRRIFKEDTSKAVPFLLHEGPTLAEAATPAVPYIFVIFDAQSGWGQATTTSALPLIGIDCSDRQSSQSFNYNVRSGGPARRIRLPW